MADFTANFTLSEIEAINATFKIDYYPMKTSQLINDNDFVSDADYVHTDNNLTNTLKSNYDAAYTHSTNTSNPHAVTKTQVGLANIPNVNPCFALQTIMTSATTLTQNTTYYFGSGTGFLTGGNFSDRYPLYVDRNCTLKSVFLNYQSNVVPSSEPCILYARVNKTTDYLISDNVVFNSSVGSLQLTDLNIPLAENNYFMFKLVTPTTWATPLNTSTFRTQNYFNIEE